MYRSLRLGRAAIPLLAIGYFVIATTAQGGEPARQIAVPLVERMPNIPQPFQIIDWKAKARDFDRLAFDMQAQGEYLPLVVLLDKPVHIAAPAFALPSYVGAKDGGEGVACLAAVSGGMLAGIGKQRQIGSDGTTRNWVAMCLEWFNPQGRQGVVLNNPNGSTGGSFWYEIFPGILFSQLAERSGNADLLAASHAQADRWEEVCRSLTGQSGQADFNHTAFNLATMKPVFNGRWREPDAAAGIGWIEYMAWRKWGQEKHLDAAKVCMDSLDRRKAQSGSPLYEVLLYYAPALAARMNAETGCDYDVEKLIHWCLSENRESGVPRQGWGILCDRFGQYDCFGLQGSSLDSGGYAFAMNTFQAAAGMAPLPRYDDRYARAVGKWLLNLTNAARLFYPDILPETMQSSPGWKSTPAAAICYEGLRKNARVPAIWVGGKSVFGRVVSGGFDKPRPHFAPSQVLAADSAGKLEHVWQFTVPADANEAICSLTVETSAAAEAFTIASSYAPNGPWKTASVFPRLGTEPKKPCSLDLAIPNPHGHDTIYLKVTAREGTAADTELKIVRFQWRIELDRSPFATGDPILYRWGPPTDLCVYGGSHVGYLASLIERTNEEHILRIDLLATDFFHDRAYPTFLYFNPEKDVRQVVVDVGSEPRDLYETTGNRFTARGVTGKTPIPIEADSAAVIVIAPAGGKFELRDGKAWIDGVIVDHSP